MKTVPENGHGTNGLVTSPFDTRISHLKILALSLLREIASAENTDEANGHGYNSIDLQAEVRRFETELIRSALIQTGGCQRQAARLLRTKVTTLNTKIKKYKIEVVVLLVSLITFASITVTAQKKLKPWQEWSRKDAETILNDSPWGKTQIETDTSEMMFRPQAAPDARGGASNADPLRDERGGATNQASTIKYRIRFLSAKPVRQAFARVISLDQPTEDPRITAYMNDFVNRQFDRWIAVAVGFESRDQRYSGPAVQAFASATAGSLKNNTYLERKDGKRLYLHLYQPPSSDGLGAKFIFERIVDERPFLNKESGEVRFVSEVGKIKLDMCFKIADMTYDGQLEY